jgi:dihydrofolate reductase
LEDELRKIVAFLFVSVDGVVGAPADWLAMSEDVAAMMVARTTSADTILLGRATYEEFATEWPQRSGPIADFFNTTRKLVVSTSLDEVSWENASLIDGNALIGDELARLRHAAGKDIVVLGSATLVQSLLRRAMIDELVLLLHPVIKGRGRRLFDELSEHAQMQKVECVTFDSGLVSLSYEMSPRRVTGHKHKSSRPHMRAPNDTTVHTTPDPSVRELDHPYALPGLTSLLSASPPIADTRAARLDEGLLVCGGCRSRLMYPADCEERGRDHWHIELRCPDCGARGWALFDVEMLDALDRELERAETEIEADLACLTRANMADYVARFVSALDAGAIEPDDFAA